MLKIEDIRALNIEPSSRCNAGCPFCSRRQKIRPYGDHFITLADFKLLPPSLVKGLRRITFGGNFGDLCCNPDLVDIATYVRKMNEEIFLEGETNGSYQDPTWWNALGARFQNGIMVFALDGLKDTHHLHRKGTNFSKILKNIEAYVAGGGTAHWKFIVFKHNEHQIHEAEQLAQEIGCRRFYAMPSRDFNDILQPPETIAFQIKRDLFADRRSSLGSEDQCALCRPLANHSLYVAADGTVHPCCYAHLMYITGHNNRFQFIVGLLEQHYHQINFKTRPIEEILRGPYFEQVFLKSKKNPYCITKCNRYRNEIRRQLLVHDRHFQPTFKKR